ncbi:MAG: hypothetical protein EXS01_01810 [Phycisphaerales bacterium]|nr:hypothetical protein [Phycisphaerales bacterium]
MSDATHKAKLKDTVRVLREQWRTLRQDWNDPASAAMERDAVDPADDAVRIAILALDQLAEAVSRARRDCDAR